MTDDTHCLEWYTFIGVLGAERKRVRLQSGEVREYVSYRLRVPKDVVERLGLHEGGTVIVRIARPQWYHLVNFNERALRRKFEEIKSPIVKAEICMLGNAPEELCTEYRMITVIASEEELRRLGLKPGQPVTLRELLERAQNDGNRGDGGTNGGEC